MFFVNFIFIKIYLNYKKERRNFIKGVNVQDWLPYDKVLENGIIISKNKFIKILKISPISYELKSDFEKQAILDSYKLFLRTCNFDIQILIQSQKEDIEDIIENIEFENNENIDNTKQEYISYIKNLNSNQKLLSKNFFILINIQKENEISLNEVNKIFFERILKIKETLSKCGNKIFEIKNRKEVMEILDSYLNPYKNRR